MNINAPAEWRDDIDDDLCRKATRGDKQAITALIERHQQWFYNIALRLVLNPGKRLKKVAYTAFL